MEERRAAPAGEMQDMVAHLQDTISSLEKSFVSAIQGVNSNLSANIATIQSMNLLMEEFVINSLSIDCTVLASNHPESSNGQVSVKVVVTNRCKFPLLRVKATVDLVLPATPSENNLTPAPTVTNLHSYDPFNLPPLQNFSCVVALTDFPFKPHNMIISASLPSPGTGKELSLPHPFTVKLFEQCTVSYRRPNEEQEPQRAQSQVFSANAAVLRKVFSVPPTEGIVDGCGFVLERGTEFKVYMRAAAPSADGQQVQLFCYQTAGEENLLTTIIEEFLALSS